MESLNLPVRPRPSNEGFGAETRTAASPRSCSPTEPRDTGAATAAGSGHRGQQATQSWVLLQLRFNKLRLFGILINSSCWRGRVDRSCSLSWCLSFPSASCACASPGCHPCPPKPRLCRAPCHAVPRTHRGRSCRHRENRGERSPPSADLSLSLAQPGQHLAAISAGSASPAPVSRGPVCAPGVGGAGAASCPVGMGGLSAATGAASPRAGDVKR